MNTCQLVDDYIDKRALADPNWLTELRHNDELVSLHLLYRASGPLQKHAFCVGDVPRQGEHGFAVDMLIDCVRNGVLDVLSPDIAGRRPDVLLAIRHLPNAPFTQYERDGLFGYVANDSQGMHIRGAIDGRNGMTMGHEHRDLPSMIAEGHAAVESMGNFLAISFAALLDVWDHAHASA